MKDEVESIAAASISQTQEENSESMQVDMSQLFLQVVGGQKKQRVYGLGSQAEAFYPDPFTGSASSRMRYTLPDPAMEERLREITEEHDEMHEAMRRERDEIDKKMRNLLRSKRICQNSKRRCLSNKRRYLNNKRNCANR